MNDYVVTGFENRHDSIVYCYDCVRRFLIDTGGNLYDGGVLNTIFRGSETTEPLYCERCGNGIDTSVNIAE